MYKIIKLKIIEIYWGLGIGPNPQSPIPNPQSPIKYNNCFNINKNKLVKLKY